jgi:hypothetical protein
MQESNRPPYQYVCSVVAFINRRLALCNWFKERAGVQGKMAGAVVKGVAGGV